MYVGVAAPGVPGAGVGLFVQDQDVFTVDGGDFGGHAFVPHPGAVVGDQVPAATYGLGVGVDGAVLVGGDPARVGGLTVQPLAVGADQGVGQQGVELEVVADAVEEDTKGAFAVAVHDQCGGGLGHA